MRRAVIDIGTNTVKLLVADVEDGKVTPVVSEDQTTRLGEGINESKRLSRTAIARTIQIIDDFLGEARRLGAPDVLALTTSATRDAVNRDEFLDGVRCKCGLEVQVITGEREAELIFCGVSSDPEWSSSPLLVLDVGGGSAEFIQGERGKIERLQSLPLGAVRLTEQFGEDFAGLVGFLRETLRQSLDGYGTRDRKMIGTGGTITTLAQVCTASASLAETQRRQPERLPYNSLDRMSLMLDELRALVTKLNTQPLPERKKVQGLPPERADIIVAGGAVFLVAMEVLEATELTVSVRNLRYGALMVD
jgi:exopolyphosphatase/guanosine-5'-triphosphate,3'-diphosphate pyrophosphatase